MPNIGKLLSATAALSLAAAPVAAQAQSSNAARTATGSWTFNAAGLSGMLQQCAQGNGCVLPLPAPTPAPAPAPAPQPAPPAPVAEPVAQSGGFNFLPILLGLGAIAGGILLLSDDDDEPASP